MKGLAAIAVLLGVTAAETGVETRLNQLVDKKELHMQRSRLLNELQSVDKKIHAIEMADDAAAADTTKANDTKTADTTKADDSKAAADTNSTSTAATTDAASNNTLIYGIAAAVVIGGAAVWWFKCRKSGEDNEGGETDDKYAKFIDNELAN